MSPASALLASTLLEISSPETLTFPFPNTSSPLLCSHLQGGEALGETNVDTVVWEETEWQHASILVTWVCGWGRLALQLLCQRMWAADEAH